MIYRCELCGHEISVHEMINAEEEKDIDQLRTMAVRKGFSLGAVFATLAFAGLFGRDMPPLSFVVGWFEYCARWSAGVLLAAMFVGVFGIIGVGIAHALAWRQEDKIRRRHFERHQALGGHAP